MKIKDLITKLQEYDPEVNIKVSDGGDITPTFYDNIKVIDYWDDDNYYLRGDF